MNTALYCYSLKGKLLKKYESIDDAAIELAIAKSQISNHLKGRQKRAHDYVFSLTPQFPGYTPRKKATHKIECYDQKGTHVATFDNVMEAAEKTGIEFSRIFDQCRRPHFFADDPYIFRYGSKIITIAPKRKPVRIVYQFDIKDATKIVNTYKTVAEASRSTKITKQSIYACCNKKGITAGGFYWSYEPTVYKLKNN